MVKIVSVYPWLWRKFGRSFGSWRLARLVATCTPAWREIPISAEDGNPIMLDLRDPACFHLLVHGVVEQAERRVVRPLLKADGISLDIGANIGTWARDLAHWSPQGKVYALEPSATTFQLLKRNARIAPTMECRRLALADTPGTLALSKEISSGVRHLADRGESVPVETLDRFAETEQLERVDFIKLDVEGAEMRVLWGGRRTIGIFRPIVMFEYMVSNASREGHTRNEIVAFFTDIGYEVKQIIVPGELIDDLGPLSRGTSNFLALPLGS